MTLIDIWKVAESEEAAEFGFSSPDAVAGSIGRLRLDRRTGLVGVIRPISAPRSDDPFAHWHTPDGLFERAARKVHLAWRTGTLPEKLTWAG